MNLIPSDRRAYDVRMGEKLSVILSSDIYGSDTFPEGRLSEAVETVQELIRSSIEHCKNDRIVRRATVEISPDRGPESRVVLLAAEGMAELDGVEWVRDATEEEIRAYRERHQLTHEEYRRVIVDQTGRPYWPVTLLDSAPEIAVERAATYY
jgi:hypothetical protein